MTLNSTLFTLLLGIFAFQLSAQTYTFELDNATYADLEGATQLTSDVWDDPTIEIPLGFDFQLYDQTTNRFFINGTIGLGAVLSPEAGANANTPLLLGNGADLIDRGYDLDTDEGTPESPISFVVEGAAGSRIAKLEYQNAGMYEDLDADGVSTDFTNFQVWLYEGSNLIEVRFGESSVADPTNFFELSKLPFIGVASTYNVSTDEIEGESLLLSNDPTDPFLVNVAVAPDSIPLLAAYPPSGTVYRFVNTLTSTQEILPAGSFSISPNPASDVIQLRYAPSAGRVEEVALQGIDGTVLQRHTAAIPQLSVAELPAGLYFLRVRTALGIRTERLVVR